MGCSFRNSRQVTNVERFAVSSEALANRSNCRQTVFANSIHQWRQHIPNGAAGINLPHQNPKAIAVQVARPEFIRMAADIENANAVPFELGQAVLNLARHRYHLPGDGAAILQPCSADFPGWDAKPVRDLPDEILRAPMSSSAFRFQR